MTQTNQPAHPPGADKHIVPVISEVADNGHLIEVVKRPETDRVQLAIWDGHRARLLDRYAGEDGKRYRTKQSGGCALSL